MAPSSGAGLTSPELQFSVCALWGHLGSEGRRVRTRCLFWGTGWGGAKGREGSPGACHVAEGEACLGRVSWSQCPQIRAMDCTAWPGTSRLPESSMGQSWLQQVGPEFAPREDEIGRQLREKAGWGGCCRDTCPLEREW